MSEDQGFGQPWELLTDHTETVCLSYPIVGAHGCPIMYVEDFVDLADARHAIACVNAMHAAGVVDPGELADFVRLAVAVRWRAKETSSLFFQHTVASTTRTRDLANAFDAVLKRLRREKDE